MYHVKINFTITAPHTEVIGSDMLIC